MLHLHLGRMPRYVFMLVVFICLSFIFTLFWTKNINLRYIMKPANMSFERRSLSSTENPYFALPKLSNTSVIPDWGAVFDGAVDCRWRCNPNLRLFIAVFSAAPNIAKRAAIRETWASAYRLPNDSSSLVHIRFFVGHVDDEQTMHKLLEEADQFGDLLIATETPDGYIQLNKKVLRGFQFIVQCFTDASQLEQPSPETYDSEVSSGDSSPIATTDLPTSHCSPESIADRLLVVKSDDDNYVNVPKLIDFATHLSASSQWLHTIFGAVQKGAYVQRSPSDKWYVPHETYPDSQYPDYVTGPLYIMCLKVLRLLVQQALFYEQSSPILSWEDIFFTGILPQYVSPPIRRESVGGIHWSHVTPVEACNYRKNVMNSHYITPEELYSLWRTPSNCSNLT